MNIREKEKERTRTKKRPRETTIKRERGVGRCGCSSAMLVRRPALSRRGRSAGGSHRGADGRAVVGEREGRGGVGACRGDGVGGGAGRPHYEGHAPIPRAFTGLVASSSDVALELVQLSDRIALRPVQGHGSARGRGGGGRGGDTGGRREERDQILIRRAIAIIIRIINNNNNRGNK